jgi:hypothetical protein
MENWGSFHGAKQLEGEARYSSPVLYAEVSNFNYEKLCIYIFKFTHPYVDIKRTGNTI